jgi:hypothetical protein
MSIIFSPPLGAQPCRYCGETKNLMLQEGMDELVVHNADGSLARDADGSVTTEYVDFIQCWTCDAMAPVATWNGFVPSAAHRAALNAYYADDEERA